MVRALTCTISFLRFHQLSRWVQRYIPFRHFSAFQKRDSPSQTWWLYNPSAIYHRWPPHLSSCLAILSLYYRSEDPCCQYSQTSFVTRCAMYRSTSTEPLFILSMGNCSSHFGQITSTLIQWFRLHAQAIRTLLLLVWRCCKISGWPNCTDLEVAVLLPSVSSVEKYHLLHFTGTSTTWCALTIYSSMAFGCFTQRTPKHGTLQAYYAPIFHLPLLTTPLKQYVLAPFWTLLLSTMTKHSTTQSIPKFSL